MYAEIRNSYASGPLYEPNCPNKEDGFFGRIAIDAWRTQNPNEAGEVVAAVLITHLGELIVEWHDNGARMDPGILEAISDAKKELRATYTERICKYQKLRSWPEPVKRAVSVLIDNGIDRSDAPEILQAIGYVLMNTELLPERRPPCSFYALLDALDPLHGISATDDEILCDNEELANHVADFLEALGFEITTGYYDPDEDKASGQEDELTGKWYIS